MNAQASHVRAGSSLAKDLQSVVTGASSIAGQVVEASENSAKRMAQANLSAFGQDMLSLDGSLDDNSNYVDADDAVNKIYEQYKNVDVGSAQETYDAMFDKSALPTVGRTRNVYRTRGIKQTTGKLLEAKEKELMFTPSVDSEYFNTWDKSVRASGLISPDDSHKYFSNIQITKFNNQAQSFLDINLADPVQQARVYNMMFGAQSTMSQDAAGNRVYSAVGSTPANEVDKQRKAFESLMGTYYAGKKAQTKTSLKKPTFTYQVGKKNAEKLVRNAEQFLQITKTNRDLGIVNVSDKQITEQELYVEALHEKSKEVAYIEDSVARFFKGEQTYEDTFRSESRVYTLSNGQSFISEVKAADYTFYANQTITKYEDLLKKTDTSPEDKQRIIAGMINAKKNSSGTIKSKYLEDLVKQANNGSMVGISSVADIQSRLEMALQYRTADGANSLDSWVTQDAIDAMSVELGSINARTDLTNTQKITLAKSALYTHQSAFEDNKIIQKKFTAFIADKGDDLLNWELGEQRFASGTLGVLNQRLNSSLLGVTDFDGFIAQNTFQLKQQTWMPFVGSEIEGVLIIKPDGAEGIDSKDIMEKLLFDAKKGVGGTKIFTDKIHGGKWGFSNTVRDGRSALTVSVIGNSGETLYQRTYIGTELVEGISIEDVAEIEARPTAAQEAFTDVFETVDGVTETVSKAADSAGEYLGKKVDSAGKSINNFLDNLFGN